MERIRSSGSVPACGAAGLPAGLALRGDGGVAMRVQRGPAAHGIRCVALRRPPRPGTPMRTGCPAGGPTARRAAEVAAGPVARAARARAPRPAAGRSTIARVVRPRRVPAPRPRPDRLTRPSTHRVAVRSARHTTSALTQRPDRDDGGHVRPAPAATTCGRRAPACAPIATTTPAAASAGTRRRGRASTGCRAAPGPETPRRCERRSRARPTRRAPHTTAPTSATRPSSSPTTPSSLRSSSPSWCGWRTCSVSVARRCARRCASAESCPRRGRRSARPETPARPGPTTPSGCCCLRLMARPAPAVGVAADDRGECDPTERRRPPSRPARSVRRPAARATARRGGPRVRGDRSSCPAIAAPTTINAPRTNPAPRRPAGSPRSGSVVNGPAVSA